MKRVSVVLLCVVAATSVQLSPAGAEAGKDDEFELLSMINRDRAASGSLPCRWTGGCCSEAGIPSSAIYWHPGVDGGRAHVILGGVWDKYAAIGYQCGAMGWPTTDTFDVSYCRKELGPIAQGFQGGLIEYSAASGAQMLRPGPISSKFSANKGHCGPAGVPTSDPYDWPGAEATWRVQTFEFRYIAEHKPTGKAYICTYQGACS